MGGFDSLFIAGREITNRFFLGTGKFKNKSDLASAIAVAGVSVVTVALRRVDPDNRADNIMNFIPETAILLVNTSGARRAEDALRIARLARAAGLGNWVKVEVSNDSKYLLPDNQETVRATALLTDEGFIVLPYMHPDLHVARQLVKAGAAAVMPLGSPIGSNRGLQAREFIRILLAEIGLPVIIDAGIGAPSHAAEAMELGAAAVLVNTAVATAVDPVQMACAFSAAVQAGRLAYRSGLPAPGTASPSSPLTGFLHSHDQL